MSRFWSTATVVTGLATLAVLLSFPALKEVIEGYPNGDFSPQLSLFQRAVSMEQLNDLFGAPPDQNKLEAMTAGNRLDLFGFIPSYGLFMVCAAAMLAGGVRRPLAWIAIAPALVGACADVLETAVQIEMTSDWSRAAALLPYVAPASWTKYFALALHGLGCAAICLLGAPRRWIIGGLGIAPIIAVSLARADMIASPRLMANAFGVFWVGLLALALISLVRTRGASR